MAKTAMPAVPSGIWVIVKDGDPRARALYERHYSCRHYRDGRKPKLFVGPGEKIVLLTPEADALLVWRKFRPMDGQSGVCCAIFRNESKYLSSALIRQAMDLAWQRWPGQRLYTYVNSAKIQSRNPGFCFKAAGWAFCGFTKKGLHILEALPEKGQNDTKSQSNTSVWQIISEKVARATEALSATSAQR